MKFKTILLLTLSTSLLWAHDLDEIEIHKNGLHVVLRKVDLDNLSPQDTQKLIDLSGDFEGIKSMFGKIPGFIFKAVHTVSSNTVLDVYRQAYTQKKEKMPEGQKYNYHYFIEDLTQDRQFMANLAISTYVDNRPKEYNDKLLLEFGLMGHPKYRRQGVLSTLALIGAQTLATYEPFSQGEFCFATRSDNVAIHKIAHKLGAQCVLSEPRETDFILYKQDLPTDLFVIPKEKLMESTLFIE